MRQGNPGSLPAQRFASRLLPGLFLVPQPATSRWRRRRWWFWRPWWSRRQPFQPLLSDQLFYRSGYQPVYFCPDGTSLVWAICFSRWQWIQDPQLVPVLRELYESLREPRLLTPDELPFGEFLREQGALSHQPCRAPAGLALEPRLWAQLRVPGIYEMAGDGEGGSWRYLYEPGRSACLTCVLHWWMERHHGPEWWERMQAWPDFRLSWPVAEVVADDPLQPGWLHYRNELGRYRGRVFSRADCNCLCEQRTLRHWGSWTHPITGPLTKVVERRRQNLWRVSLHLHNAYASGAHSEKRRARRAALAEACERWAALQPCLQSRLRVQRLNGKGGRTCWSGLVYLGEVPDPRGPQLSHGLACRSSLRRALQAGLWELLERDALRRWWRAWRAGRPAPGLRRHGEFLWSLPGGVFLAFVGRNGKGAWGSAAGPRARQRAVREARHNYQLQRRRPPANPSQCLTFSDHAAWAWHNCLPRWDELMALPCSSERPIREVPDKPIYYYRFDCPWADRLGWTVVKVLSPFLRGLPIGGEPPFHPFP